MRYIVVKKTNSKSAKQFKIVAPVITIGRTSENSIALKDNTISRQHCVIETSQNVTRIRDLGSFHGFLLNQKQTRKAILKHGDCITLGTYELYYMIRDEDESPEANEKAIESIASDAASTVTENGNPTTGTLESDANDETSEIDLSLVDAHHEAEPENPLEGSAHLNLPLDERNQGDVPLDIELKSGDFPIVMNEPVRPEANEEMDLNSLVGKPSVETPPPPPVAPTPPLRSAPAPPPVPAPAPRVESTGPDPRLADAEAQLKQLRQEFNDLLKNYETIKSQLSRSVQELETARQNSAAVSPRINEAEAHTKQLQNEFGELLKQFEANKKRLAKTLETLEGAQLKSTTTAKKYTRAVEKIASLESEFAEVKELLAKVRGEEAQHNKDYLELDERHQAAEQQLEELRRQVAETEASLNDAEKTSADLEKQRATLQKGYSELDAQVKQYQLQFSTARKKIATLETNINTVQESRMRAKNLAATLEKERNDLQAKLDDAVKQRDTHQTRSVALESELGHAIKGQTLAEGKIVAAQKTTLSRDEKMQSLETELAATRDTISDLEDELEDARGEMEKKLSASTSSPGGGGLDEERVKRKLVAMEKERRKAIAIAQNAQKQLAASHQQATVLQSFLDEREQLITKLRKKLREAGGDEDTKGD